MVTGLWDCSHTSVFTRVNARRKLAVLCAGVIFYLKYLAWSGTVRPKVMHILNIERYYMLLSFNFIHRLWVFMYINTIPKWILVYSKKMFLHLKTAKVWVLKVYIFKNIFLGLSFICIFNNSLETVHFLWICKSYSYVMKIYHLFVMQTTCWKYFPNIVVCILLYHLSKKFYTYIQWNHSIFSCDCWELFRNTLPI